MWSNHDKNNHTIPARTFSTPPPSWKTSPHSPAAVVMPMSERKISGCRRDLFHVVHKVPSGDSPYVRAKHVQLIDKEPSKAISLFWAAINAGDRVDSALKDMAVVMKQLDRSDEAIEAIKSFRHRCSYESQESLDNVLVELYKRSGRIEEEIEMLQHKLKNIEEGVAFGGKRTKIARSQGKKVQITVEQEKSRILGNLAWAYLQHHDYGLAEQHYRKALALEVDYNKQCNLALCLMHMKRIPEAKSLLQDISASCGRKEMDESFAKSFDRAVEMLNEFEERSLLKPIQDDKENLDSGWRKGPCNERSDFSGKMVVSPAAVLYTQPRRDSESLQGGQRNVLARTIRNLDGDLQESDIKSQSSLVAPADRNWRGVAQVKSTGKSPYLLSQPRTERGRSSWRSYSREDNNTNAQMIPEKQDQTIVFYEPKGKSTDSGGNKFVGMNNLLKSASKRWADMVEEEEQKLLTGEKLRFSFEGSWKYGDESSDENLDSNMPIEEVSPVETISQKLEAIDLKNSYDTFNNSGSPRNSTARRSLCFDAKKDSPLKRKNRLQVFRDITPTPDDSP
ncbi:protein POLLENLESS 3 [Mercurialis annua]|uniref:protein POLLENLESS 3 n=1 Tax=Mercurialis annua TaxID=3986 RepID=UPI00215EFDD4|nr:protein POLLENLESS 3 [Mercurialis annua]